jgi:hypothetical protein
MFIKYVLCVCVAGKDVCGRQGLPDCCYDAVPGWDTVNRQHQAHLGKRAVPGGVQLHRVAGVRHDDGNR